MVGYADHASSNPIQFNSVQSNSIQLIQWIASLECGTGSGGFLHVSLVRFSRLETTFDFIPVQESIGNDAVFDNRSLASDGRWGGGSKRPSGVLIRTSTPRGWQAGRRLNKGPGKEPIRTPAAVTWFSRGIFNEFIRNFTFFFYYGRVCLLISTKRFTYSEVAFFLLLLLLLLLL